jgi:hypothetical protein
MRKGLSVKALGHKCDGEGSVSYICSFFCHCEARNVPRLGVAPLDFDIFKLTLLKSGRAIADTLAFNLALHPHGTIR